MDRDKTILSKQVIANKATKNYLAKYPSLTYLKDDLRSAATFGIIKAIDRLISQSEPIDDAYLMVAAKRSISDAVNDLGDALRIPRSTKNLAANNGVKIDPIFIDRLPSDIVDDRGSTLLAQVLECCVKDEERTIIRMLAANYSQREIADHLKINFRRVSEAIQNIKQRFDSDEDGTAESYQRIPLGANGKCPGLSKESPCGKPVARWANAEYCEDCQAGIYSKFDGRSQRVRINARVA